MIESFVLSSFAGFLRQLSYICVCHVSECVCVYLLFGDNVMEIFEHVMDLHDFVFYVPYGFLVLLVDVDVIVPDIELGHVLLLAPIGVLVAVRI